MKVRLEFYNEDGNRESSYDMVEFTTAAVTIEDWGYAILDVVRTAIWTDEVLLLSALSALIEMGGFKMTSESLFVQAHRDGLRALRDELTKLVCQEAGAR